MRHHRVLVVPFLLVVLCMCLVLGEARPGPSVPVIPEKSFARQSPHTVLEVIDGDTVKIDYDGTATTVRLIGVDAPETVHPEKPVEFYGKQASAFLKNLLKGESVYVEVPAAPSDRDKYDRLLAYLYRSPDGLFVNLEIVRQGYGHAYTEFPFEHLELFRHYEKVARESEKGLWDREAKLAEEPRPVTLFGSPIPTPLVKESRLRAEPPSGKAASSDVTVYVTKTGKKYHRDGCRYLSKSKIAVSLSEAKARGYGPCSVCGPPR